MEYDPASPTDEVEEYESVMDLSTIPLPESTGPVMNEIDDVIDIPLPPISFSAADIPLPPTAPDSISREADVAHSTSFTDQSEADPAPLKFSLRISTKPLGQDGPTESSNVFESTKDIKTDDLRSMPKLQALMKRSKPSQLPVGVLPSKTKLPAAEIKTELFLPTKESDSNGVQPNFNESLKVTVPNLLSNVALINSQVSMSNLAGAEVDGSSKETCVISGNTTSEAHFHGDTIGFNSVGNNAVASVNTTQSSTLTANTIPNLMSITVQPIQSLSLGQSNNMSSDPAAVLRQTKMNLANMQYVNPQKLRSAQMIATPLIANPAIAAQPHHDDQSKSRDRRRSRSGRSRSGRRSSTSRRGRRHRSSSSSSSSPPRRSPRRYQRRSRSRQRSSPRYTRNRAYSRNRDRDRREYERRRERLADTDSKRNHRDDRVERRQDVRRSPSKDSMQIRRRSPSRDRSVRSKVLKRSPDRRGSHRDKVTKREEPLAKPTKNTAHEKISSSPRKSRLSSEKLDIPADKAKSNTKDRAKQSLKRRPSPSSNSGSESSASSRSSHGSATKIRETAPVKPEQKLSNASQLSSDESDSTSRDVSSSSDSEGSETSHPEKHSDHQEPNSTETKLVNPSGLSVETEIGKA